MEENIALNGLVDGLSQPKPLPLDEKPSKIRVNEGDCSTVMYTHRGDNNRFDVVDLDPYGTASPFLDAAVQSVSDGGRPSAIPSARLQAQYASGLLCVTCTDLAVLAGSNYPEKW